MTFPLDVDYEVLPFSGKWRTYVLIVRCCSVGVYIRFFFLHLSSSLHRRCIWHYWQAEAHMRITSVDFEGLHERSHTAHVFACVLNQISLLVACRSRKLPSGFQLNLLQTLSVCPEGPALMENHQSHTIEALLLTAVSISPIKLP